MKAGLRSHPRTESFSRLILLLVFLGLWMTACAPKSDPDATRVLSFSPSGEVQQGTNLTVSFSREVVPDSLLDRFLDETPVHFEPALPGRFKWIAADQLRFYPDVVLAPSTEYVAEVASKIGSYRIAGDRVFQFHTRFLRVENASLLVEFNPESNASADLLATIQLNYAVEPGKLAKHVRLASAEGSDIPYSLVTATESSTIKLIAEDVPRTDVGREIRLIVEPGTIPSGGSSPMRAHFEEPITLPGQAELKVFDVRAQRESPAGGTVRLNFSIPVSPDEASEFVRVEPAVDIRIRGEHRDLIVRGDFEPDRTYSIVLEKGLKAIDGTALERTFTSSFSFVKEDIEPQIDFVGKGYFLTRGGNLNLGLSTINVDQVTVDVRKVFANNLVYLLNTQELGSTDYWYYDYGQLAALGKSLLEYDVHISGPRNDEVVTPLDVVEVLSGDRRGVFKITARSSEERWISATKWIVATDIGLAVKQAGDEMWVWAQSLKGTFPIESAEITLFSRNNQVLGSATTGPDGFARLPVEVVEEGLDPYLVTAVKGDDVSFVDLSRHRIQTSDYDVGGAPYLMAGYDAFMFDERGVYRPGERVHVGAVIRGPGGTVSEPFPVFLRVAGPDQRVLEELRGLPGAQGTLDFSFVVPDYGRTGRYTATLMLAGEEAIGVHGFSVEEFIPDRMKVSVAADRDSYLAGESAVVDVEGVNLFGPPAAGRRVDVRVEFEPYPFEPDQWSAFRFVDETRTFSAIRREVVSGTLDDAGKYSAVVPIPPGVSPPSALRGVLSASVIEPGGRAVTAYDGFVVHPRDAYVGVRSLEEGYGSPGRASRFEFIVTDVEGDALPGRDVEVTLIRFYWNSMLRQVNGRYRYVSEKVEETISRQTLISSASPMEFSLTPPEYGQYRVLVRDGGSGAQSTHTFYASGWGYAPWAMDKPERLEIDFDREVYAIGDRAQVQIRAPFDGKLLLTVETDRLIEHRIIDLEGNTATVEVPVGENLKPNAYVAGLLIRTTQDLERDMPVRAFGVAPLMVDNASNRLDVELAVVDDMRPRNAMEVGFRVSGAGADGAEVAVIAVDEGILQLTDFGTPDPLGHFLGKKRLSVASFDLYGFILPEIAPTVSSPAGDIEAARRRQIAPQAARRVRPVAFWSGWVPVNRRGEGRVEFDVPEFNGTVRVMALAVAGDQYGNSDQKVLVRDPVVLTPTFPRFVSMDDVFEVPVSVANTTSRSLEMEVALEAEGPVVVSGVSRKTVRVEPEQEQLVVFDAVAGEAPGTARMVVRAEGGGVTTSSRVEFAHRPPAPLTTYTGSGRFSDDAPATFTFPESLLEGTASFELTIAPFPELQFAQSLQHLLRYPHGCIEQVTSRAFPLLYFDDVVAAVEPELVKRNSADYYVEEAIQRLQTMQLQTGAFSYWPNGGYSNDWATIYAAHFLVEARKAGYWVSDGTYDSMIGALRSLARSYRGSDGYGYQPVAYAAYVLSLAGRPDRGVNHYLRNNVIDRLSLYSQYHLAGAYAYAGDREAARELLPQSIAATVERESGGHFNSALRSQAIMLEVLNEVDSAHPNIPRLVQAVSDALNDRSLRYSTQENGLAFLALGKVLRNQAGSTYTGSVELNGTVIAQFDNTSIRFQSEDPIAGTEDDWTGAEVTITSRGDGTGYFYWRADGIPTTKHIDEFDRDLRVRRRFLREDGSPLIAGSQLIQGDLLVAEISVAAVSESIENVAIVDLLPAGLEIENPRLETSQDISWVRSGGFRPEYTDIRDDRLVIYGRVDRGAERKFYYTVRAVTAGTFVLPPIRAEAMYTPEKASVASSGTIRVQAPVSG